MYCQGSVLKYIVSTVRVAYCEPLGDQKSVHNRDKRASLACAARLGGVRRVALRAPGVTQSKLFF